MRLVYLSIWLVLTCCSCAGTSGGGAVPNATQINTLKDDAHGLIAAGDYQAAIAILQPLADKDVKDSQLYTMLGEANARLGQYAAATAHFESALRLDYGDAEAHLKLATMLMEMGKVGRALTEFELAVQFGEDDPLPHYNYGLALHQLGREDEALAQWRRAYALDGQSAQYAEAVGIGLSGRDDPGAREHFARADELGADSPSFHNNYGLLLQRLSEFAEAQSQFQQALALEPDNATYRTNLAIVYMNQGNYEAATPLWEALFAEGPDDRTRRTYLGKCYFETGRFGDVIPVLEDWLATQQTSGTRRKRGALDAPKGPGLDEAYDILAMSHRGLGDLDAAARFMDEALRLNPSSITHLNNYGVILAESGKIEEAKAQWEKVLELEPDNAVARQNLSALRK